MRQYVQAGRYGRKVGKGVYEYDADGKRRAPEHRNGATRARAKPS